MQECVLMPSPLWRHIIMEYCSYFCMLPQLPEATNVGSLLSCSVGPPLPLLIVRGVLAAP